MKYFLFIFIAFTLFSCKQQTATNENSTANDSIQKPLNVILLIGDGMGLSQVSSVFYFSETNNFSRFKNIGLINTSSASHRITDSGAGGSAFSIGEKTYNGAIAVGVDSLPRTSITELLSQKNYKIGIVATCEIPHATPASFFAHSKSRKSMDEIAAQLHSSGVDFFAAGGTNYFLRRADGFNYFDSLVLAGFVMDTLTLDKEIVAEKKYGFLLAPDAMPSMLENRGDFLPNASEKAINYLSQNNDGFFLMIEGSQIDWAGHDNNADYLIAEMNDFDKTVGRALDFAERNGNTLVIVLADHETGGFALAASGAEGMKGDYNIIAPAFATSGHSTALIPVFAFGPGADSFMGIYQNNDIFHKILALIK